MQITTSYKRGNFHLDIACGFDDGKVKLLQYDSSGTSNVDNDSTNRKRKFPQEENEEEEKVEEEEESEKEENAQLISCQSIFNKHSS